ncbi:MAG: hypothetical protein KF893_25405 [Caldilineaceae bacterium]|nr:hypothetical protein [Caldilineaceae bacterium]
MKELYYTLLSDGSSDRALLPILTWVLAQHLPATAIQAVWADLGRLPRPPKDLSSRIETAIALYPCDILFVHRDAERDSPEHRYKEIQEASPVHLAQTIICVVPIRMLEAWLLLDLVALRTAAGNPNGVAPLSLPVVEQIESLPDPKSVLFDLLRTASDLPRNRRNRLPFHKLVHRVAALINDFSPLRGLAAFRRLEQDVMSQVQSRTERT